MGEIHEEIKEFFSQQGETCLKIVLHSSTTDHTLNFGCTIRNSMGTTEKVMIRIKLANKTSPHFQTHCVR